MPHTHPTQNSPTDALLRIAVPSNIVTSSSSTMVIRTCAKGVIRIPKSLVKTNVKSDHVVVFEARVPSDVATAIRSIYDELSRLIDVLNSTTGEGREQD
jgi:hypothetical protein